jgi:plasmid maintenance system antidote protein VapI
MHWRRNRLATELDITQDRLRRFLDGVQPIPRHMALACAALAIGLQPLGESMPKEEP